MNKVFLIGRPTKDAEVRQNNEIKVARFTLAVDRYKSDADFIPCVAFNKQADFAEQYLRKGKKIAVIGNWKTGKYKNKDGVMVYTHEVNVESYDFCESKGEEENKTFTPKNDFDDVEIPFD